MWSKKNKTKKETFSRMKWKNWMSDMNLRPELIKVENGHFFEKRFYHWEDIRLIVFNYDTGNKRFFVYDRFRLQVEAEYDGEKNAIYVTSDSFMKMPFFYMQEDIVQFLESFAERENNGLHDKLVRKQVEKEWERVYFDTDYDGLKKELEELKMLYERVSYNEINMTLQMKEALRYLKSRAYKNTSRGNS